MSKELTVLKKELNRAEMEILSKIGKNADSFENYAGGDESSLYEKVYYIYVFGDLRGDMPYDVATAKSGDPVVWLNERMGKLFQN